MGPLEGVRVADFSQLIGGPGAASLLASLGAEVVKIEAPSGDPSRGLKSAAYGDARISAAYLAYNRGKRNIALDLKQPAGVEVARRIIARSDVVIESFRPGVMDRLGLGAETVMAEQPDLVYASISAFGFGESPSPQITVTSVPGSLYAGSMRHRETIDRISHWYARECEVPINAPSARTAS